ncbi:MAG: MoaD/ThiS family protein [Deltaproteobacteria bacterium]|nr:MoaD/ThiS family protein [Deltaproteobacteria bacterium]
MIKIRFFAGIKERVGKKEVILDSKGGSVADILNAIEKDIPGISEILLSLKAMVAVNHEMAGIQTLVKDGDEVAFIPPFSGG